MQDVQDLYTENRKILLKEILKINYMERYTIFVNWKNQYYLLSYELFLN